MGQKRLGLVLRLVLWLELVFWLGKTEMISIRDLVMEFVDKMT